MMLLNERLFSYQWKLIALCDNFILSSANKAHIFPLHSSLTWPKLSFTHSTTTMLPKIHVGLRNIKSTIYKKAVWQRTIIPRLQSFFFVILVIASDCQNNWICNVVDEGKHEICFLNQLKEELASHFESLFKLSSDRITEMCKLEKQAWRSLDDREKFCSDNSMLKTITMIL